MPDCVFCGIVAGEEPAHRLLEDDRTVAFLDHAPVNPGHALVVPRDHHERLTDMAPALTADVFRTVRRVAGAVESALDPDGYNVVQSNGAAAGQEVFPAHGHVLPSFGGDGVRVHWPHGDLGDESGEARAARLRAEL